VLILYGYIVKNNYLTFDILFIYYFMSSANDIDTNVNSYTNDELLEILELDSGSGSLTVDDIQDKVQLMMRQYPSIAFFFAQVGERLESEYAYADDVADEEGEEDKQDEADVWLKNQYLRQDGAKEFKQYTSRDNKVQVFEDGNGHEQMKQERLGAVNAINVPVSQGSLNPVLKNITSRIVMLDSTYRQNIVPYNSPVSSSTDYTLDLSDTLKDTLSIKLSSVQIPFTWYNYADYLGNTCFMYVTSATPFPDNDLNLSVMHQFRIVNGSYTSSSTLLTALNSVTPAPPFSFSIVNNSFKITNNSGNYVRIVFYNGNNPTMSCGSNTGCNFPSKLDNNLGWNLGFRSSNIGGVELALAYDLGPSGSIPPTLKDSVTASVPYCNIGPNYFLLVVDDFNQNHLNQGLVNIDDTDTTLNPPSYINADINYACFNTDEGFNSPYPVYIPNAPARLTQAQLYSANQILENRRNTTNIRTPGPTTTDVLAVIPLKVGGLSFGDKYIEFGSSLLQNERVYFGPVNISRMRVTLRDDKGNVVNLNGADWSFSLISTHLYEF
jgi:hypothetical protein